MTSVVGAQNIQYWNVHPEAQAAKVFGDLARQSPRR
jgi:hypothetical protein